MGAELAGIDVRQIVAHRTTADRALDLDNAFGKFGRARRIHLQYEKCKTLRGLCTDARQLLELFNESRDRLRDIHRSKHAGNFQTARHAAELTRQSLVDL